jgi:hypothetical protein
MADQFAVYRHKLSRQEYVMLNQPGAALFLHMVHSQNPVDLLL